jgi:hypothetical protein
MRTRLARGVAPRRARVLLVAESHVAEQPGDADVIVRLPSLARPAVPLPEGYCRLVYCLWYVENPLCGTRLPSSNGGTWQYWGEENTKPGGTVNHS